MEQNEKRVLIKYYYVRGKSSKETKEEHIYGISAPLNTAVKKWTQEFVFGRTRVQPRLGGPLKAATPEMIKKNTEILVTGDRKLDLCEIAMPL